MVLENKKNMLGHTDYLHLYIIRHTQGRKRNDTNCSKMFSTRNKSCARNGHDRNWVA
jgi:hypothetical protein